MNEQLISDNFVVFSLIWLILNFTLFIIITWYGLRNSLKKFAIFDMTFIIGILMIIGARLVAVIGDISQFTANGFRLAPITEAGETWGGIWNFLPWNIFNITDHKFILLGGIVGIIIGVNIVYRLLNRTKSIKYLSDKVIFPITIILAINCGLLLVFDSGGYIDIPVFPISLLCIAGVMFIALSRINLFKHKMGLLSSLFYITLCSIIFINNYLNYRADSTVGIYFESLVGLFILSYAIIQLLGLKSDKDQDEYSRENIKRDYNSEDYNPARYKQGFTDNEDLYKDMPLKERVTININNFKRRVKK